jgi:hypothetical protein
MKPTVKKMLLVSLLSMTFIAQQTSAAKAKKDDSEILCERSPTAYLVGETKEGTSADNPCRASAKIQAIAYECGESIDTYPYSQRAFKANIEKAKKKCQDFCEDVDSRCVGRIQDQPGCGFTIPTHRAVDTGKNIVKCPKHCKGQAFNYCSLYHANFFATDPQLFKDKSFNCICKRK